jgi:acyl-homoserine-lactone acylase
MAPSRASRISNELKVLSMNKTARLAAAAVLAGIALAGCVQPQPNLSGAPETPYSAEIRRTQAGIPHIKAADWGSLGYGYGYAQAQDNLCTLADAFVTYRGERSAWFGPDARPPSGATFGQPRNLDADFFFRLVDDAAAVERYRSAQPATLQTLIEGFAAGYNRYLGDLDAGRFPTSISA